MGQKRYNERTFKGYQSDLVESIKGEYEFQDYLRNKNKIYVNGYFCYEHKLYFWRDNKQHGKCSNCLNFNNKIHVAVNSVKYKIEVKGMVKVTKAIKVEDGKHNAKIVDVLERTSPYEYTDFVVKVGEAELKYGCPTTISIEEDGTPNSRLAKILIEMGMKIELNANIEIDDIKKIAIGKEVSILTENEKTTKGTFARIVSMKIN